MKHSLKYKKSHITTIFQKKLQINNISIKDKNDISNLINSLLIFIELEKILTPTDCIYGFFNNQIFFSLESVELKDKKDFFDALKTFEEFMKLD